MASRSPIEHAERSEEAHRSGLHKCLFELKSVDGVLKRYMDDVNYPDGDDRRLDILQVERAVRVGMQAVHDSVMLVSSLGEKRVGQVVGEWTILRAPFSMELLLAVAHRGALFEPLTIARMMLEQLAWAAAALEEIDDERVAEISAQASIRTLKRVAPLAGRLYGWLSEHAHWKYDAHIKSFVIEGDGLGHLFGSCTFKAVSLATSLAVTAVFVRFIQSLLGGSKSKNTELTRCRKAVPPPALSSCSRFGEIQQLMRGNEDVASLEAIFY